MKNEKSDWDFTYSAPAPHDEEFAKHKVLLSDRWHQLILDMIKLANLDFSSEKTTVLEVGCGIGSLCVWTSKRSKETTGLDIAKPALKVGNILRRKFKTKVDFVVGDARSLPFGDESYDIVICTEILEHVLDYRKAFNELVRVTKRSGYIIITVPNYINMCRLYIPFDILLYLTGRRQHVLRQPDDVNRFNTFVINKLFERKDLKTIIKRGVGLLHIPSDHPKIKSMEMRLNGSFDRIKFFCINIGVVAQKIK